MNTNSPTYYVEETKQSIEDTETFIQAVLSLEVRFYFFFSIKKLDHDQTNLHCKLLLWPVYNFLCINIHADVKMYFNTSIRGVFWLRKWKTRRTETSWICTFFMLLRFSRARVLVLFFKFSYKAIMTNSFSPLNNKGKTSML